MILFVQKFRFDGENLWAEFGEKIRGESQSTWRKAVSRFVTNAALSIKYYGSRIRA